MRPYTFHGLDLSVSPAGTHMVGDCPFCGRGDGKFSIELTSGVGRCWVCGIGSERGGINALAFTRLIWENAADAILGGDPAFYAAVAQDRGFLSEATPKAWGVRRALDGTWLLPGYGADHGKWLPPRLDQVYRRTKIKHKNEWVWRLLPTPDIWPAGKSHALHMAADDFDPARPNIIICEGPWDGMALWEVRWGRWATDTNIVAVPGCSTWRDEWTELCRGKHVTIMFDSDHPNRVVPGGRESRAGYDGTVRIAKRLSGAAATVKWLRWGPEGYDPDKPDGYDVRDHLRAAGDDLKLRQAARDELMTRVEDAPSEWFNAMTPMVHVNGYAHEGSIEAQPCHSWAECEGAWKEAMWWRQDMSDATAVMLAVCASTMQSGNQLCVDVVGSAGCGKTTICEGLLVSGHCHNLEHLTGFHSGWKMADDQSKDCSLIARINGKTLVTPEFDIMRASPRYAELMSQQRRIFDGKSGATFKNTDKDTLYVGLRTPWIRAGTPAIMDTDQASMGDRFLRIIISDPSDEEKRQIIRKAVRSERTALMERTNGTAGSLVDPKTRKAHALTGGYVDWLRANVEDEVAKVVVSEAAEEFCIDLAELSADLRARPNEDKKRLEPHDTKELPTRLARQNIRMASFLAVAMNKPTVDADVLRIVRKMALDTASGHSLKMVWWLCNPNPKTSDGQTYQETGGLMAGILESWTGMDKDRLQRYLAYLCNIDVLERREMKQMGPTWRLTERVYHLYLRVMSGVE